MRNTINNLLIPAGLILCLLVTAAGCGSGQKKGDTAGDVQTEGLILYAGNGQFVVSGYSDEYPSTSVYITLDGEDKGFAGSTKTEGDYYMGIFTNATDVKEELAEEEAEGWQKLELKAYGVSDTADPETKTEDCVSKVFYVKSSGEQGLLLESILATDEKSTPADWEWK